MVTNPRIVFIIVCGLLTFGMVGLISTVYLIVSQADPALIAVVAGQTGTSIGGLMSMMNNTRTQAQPAANIEPSPQPTPVEVVNTSSQPVPVDTKP